MMIFLQPYPNKGKPALDPGTQLGISGALGVLTLKALEVPRRGAPDMAFLLSTDGSPVIRTPWVLGGKSLCRGPLLKRNTILQDLVDLMSITGSLKIQAPEMLIEETSDMAIQGGIGSGPVIRNLGMPSRKGLYRDLQSNPYLVKDLTKKIVPNNKTKYKMQIIIKSSV